MFGERGGDFNSNTKEQNRNSYKNPERTGHANETNYLGAVVCFALLYKRNISFLIFPVIAEKVFKKGGRHY
jgi:hypothetical protein